MSRVMLYEGDVITCPRCGKQIAQALRDVYAHEQRSSKAFQSFIGDLSGKHLYCPDDGSPYTRVGQVHVASGWQ